MDFDDLSPELREKVKACETPDELFALVESEGIALSDEQLDAISGGWNPQCSSYRRDVDKCRGCTTRQIFR